MDRGMDGWMGGRMEGRMDEGREGETSVGEDAN